MSTVVLILQLYLVVILVDVGLAWVQPEPGRWPRRATHMLTEPPQALVRRVLVPARTGGWDLSPLVVIGALGVLRVWLIRCWL